MRCNATLFPSPTPPPPPPQLSHTGVYWVQQGPVRRRCDCVNPRGRGEQHQRMSQSTGCPPANCPLPPHPPPACLPAGTRTNVSTSPGCWPCWGSTGCGSGLGTAERGAGGWHTRCAPPAHRKVPEMVPSPHVSTAVGVLFEVQGTFGENCWKSKQALPQQAEPLRAGFGSDCVASLTQENTGCVFLWRVFALFFLLPYDLLLCFAIVLGSITLSVTLLGWFVGCHLRVQDR